MGQEENNSLIAEFVDITQASPDEAHEFLEASNWSLQDALTNFYAEGGESSPAAGQGRASASPSAGNVSESSGGIMQGAGQFVGARRFATFADLNRDVRSSTSPAHSTSSDDDNDDDDTEKYFTGGEKSGLEVQNPDSKSNSKLIADIFRQAARNERERMGGPGDESAGSGSGTPRNVFSGAGFTLGGDSVPSQRVEGELSGAVGGPGGLAGSANPFGEGEGTEERVIRRLTFWRDGFSVEDGPLYRYDDPANVAHLRAINSGRAPLALLNVQSGQGVDVHIIRKTDEDYKAPKKPQGGFHGRGNRLGSPIPGEKLERAPSQFDASASTSAGTAAKASTSTTLIGEGDTTVQLRLGNGQAIRIRLQSEGPVQQLYDYVDQNTNDGRAYVLQTTFPNRELSDKTMTLKEAGACGAVVVQKWN